MQWWELDFQDPIQRFKNDLGNGIKCFMYCNILGKELDLYVNINSWLVVGEISISRVVIGLKIVFIPILSKFYQETGNSQNGGLTPIPNKKLVDVISISNNINVSMLNLVNKNTLLHPEMSWIDETEVIWSYLKSCVQCCNVSSCFISIVSMLLPLYSHR